jgi:hypothetical protein
VKIDTFVNCVLLHFKRVLFSEISLNYELLDSVYAVSSYSHILNENIIWGQTFKVCEVSMNWEHLIKGPPDRQ